VKLKIKHYLEHGKDFLLPNALKSEFRKKSKSLKKQKS